MKLLKLYYLLLFALQILTTPVDCNLFENYEKTIFENDGPQATANLLDSIIYGQDKPKEIEIFCPGPAPPVVTIRDIVQETLDGSENKCMTLRLTGANFNMKLTVNCDDNDPMTDGDED